MSLFLLPSDLFTHLPAQGNPLPIVANLPHSGLKIPDEMAAQFTPEHLRSLPNSDWHLQPLYRFLPSLGITVLAANYSRYVVDLNRGLTPPFFGSFWSAVVPEETAFKEEIYVRKPSKAEVRSRIEEFYTPYHHKLAALLNEAIAQFHQVTLLDLHSFMGLITDDVCLGNARGQTCPSELIDAVAQGFSQRGYQVVKNKVFTGGFITRHYGKQPSVNALQIELRYPTYLPNDQLETDITETDSQSSDSQSSDSQAPAYKVIPQWQGPKFDQAQTNLKALFEQLITEDTFR